MVAARFDKGALTGARTRTLSPYSTARPAPEPRPAPPSEQTGTGLKPWSSGDLVRVPGHEPQFPGPRDSEAGGGAGSGASWGARGQAGLPGTRPGGSGRHRAVVAARGAGGKLNPGLVSTQPQTR